MGFVSLGCATIRLYDQQTSYLFERWLKIRLGSKTITQPLLGSYA